MTTDFDRAVEFVLGFEGGYTNHPSDPGGATNFGITIHDVRRYIDAHATPKTVKKLTRDQAKQIYRAHYWNAIHGDALPWPINFLVFDMGVNAGVSRGVKLAQRVVGVKEDGVLGPITLAALNEVEPQKFNNAYAEKRLAFYRSLKTFKTFGRGWTSRTKQAHSIALC